MELIVTVAVIVLSIVFTGSLLALLVICRQKYCNKQFGDEKPILKYTRDHFFPSSAAENGGLKNAGSSDGLESEFEDVLQLSPNIEKYLKEYDWVYDATGLVQHCLAILKICHQITDKLSALSFRPVHGPQELMDEVREATRRVMPRVDDLVRTMYASHHYKGKTANGSTVVVPLAPLLEARAAALAMALSSLSTVFKVAYPRAVVADWLRESLKDMEGHLEALRIASEHEEQSEREKVEVLCPASLAAQPVSEESEYPNQLLMQDKTNSSILLPPPRRPQNRSGLYLEKDDVVDGCSDEAGSSGLGSDSSGSGSSAGSYVC